MPSDDARNAFDAAQKIAAKMRDVHAREDAIDETRRQSTGQPTIEALDSELVQLRHEWLRLAAEYSAAVGRFNVAAAEERRSGNERK